MTTQFEGETPWDAIINDNSLDIVEEEEFKEFCEACNVPVNDLDALLKAFKAFVPIITWNKCLDCGTSVGGGLTRCNDCAGRIET